MIILRLQRIGRKNDPHFRLVATDSRNAAKSGRFLEILGTYNVKAGEFAVKEDRVKHWIKMGAKTSATTHNLLLDKKIVEGKKKNVLPRKSPVKKEEVAKAA